MNTTTTPRIIKIEDLYVIEQEQQVGPEDPVICVYWPDGYESLEQAQQAIDAFERGEPNPAGVPVQLNTGRRR